MASLDQITKEYREVTQLEKEIKARKDDLRAEILAQAEIDYNNKEHLLPTTTITIPKEFWHLTELTPAEFFPSRFPTWDVIAEKSDNLQLQTTYVLRKNKKYMPFGFENDDFKLTKSSTEPTPEIDWNTLRAELPDIFERLADEVVIYEINEAAFEQLLNEVPEFNTVIQRHTKFTREPQQRIAVKEQK